MALESLSSVINTNTFQALRNERDFSTVKFDELPQNLEEVSRVIEPSLEGQERVVVQERLADVASFEDFRNERIRRERLLLRRYELEAELFGAFEPVEIDRRTRFIESVRDRTETMVVLGSLNIDVFV